MIILAILKYFRVKLFYIHCIRKNITIIFLNRNKKETKGPDDKPSFFQIAEAAAFLRSMDPNVFPPQEYPEGIEDTTSGENAPDLELISSPLAWTEHGSGPVPPGDLASMGAILLRPVYLENTIRPSFC